MKTSGTEFWETKRLSQLTRREWERLCDGCARCCVHKLKAATGRIYYTSVACRLLDPTTCRCRRYRDRRKFVPGCVILDAATIKRRSAWLPPTCAYRLLSEGKPLPAWHPLVTGDRDSTRKAGMSARDRTISEADTDALGEQVLRVLTPPRRHRAVRPRRSTALNP